MQNVRRINGLLLIASVTTSALAISQVACNSSSDQARPRPPTTQLIAERPLPPSAQPTLIKQGKSPLVYLTESAGTLRFVDMTASENELARALVQPRQIVRIDATRGVMLGENVLRPGPLPVEHVYGIWLEPDTSNYSRNSMVNPQPGRNTSDFNQQR